MRLDETKTKSVCVCVGPKFPKSDHQKVVQRTIQDDTTKPTECRIINRMPNTECRVIRPNAELTECRVRMPSTSPLCQIERNTTIQLVPEGYHNSTKLPTALQLETPNKTQNASCKPTSCGCYSVTIKYKTVGINSNGN